MNGILKGSYGFVPRFFVCNACDIDKQPAVAQWPVTLDAIFKQACVYGVSVLSCVFMR
jgi:hypothetical protein